MRLHFRNERSQLRDGWKSVFFLLACAACFVLVGIVGRLLPPGLKPYAPSALLIASLGLLLTWAAVRLEASRLGGIGLHLDWRFLRQLALGLLAGALLVGASTALVCAFAGVELVRIEAPAAALQAKLVVMVLCGALFEELLFRGFAFQRAVRGMGRWPAIVVFALLFCLAHVPSNLDVETPMLVTAMAGLFVDSVIQSLILLRTRSLAVPIGLHAAWNLLQGALGFGVSGASTSPGWFRPELGNAPGWLTGGAYGLEASVFALALQGVLLVWLLGTRQRGSSAVAERAVPA